jgi:hypothetical protein
MLTRSAPDKHIQESFSIFDAPATMVRNIGYKAIIHNEICMKFDVVYTWVDGGDPEYMCLVDRFAEKSTDRNPERYRDNLQLMRYSIRLVENFFNHFDSLILVTARAQVPTWLNVDHPRLRIVHHDEFIPKEYLPTFNSNVIESFLHLIPGLSNHFLYMNDDFLFGNPLPPNAFMTNGKYKVFNTLFGENLKWRVHDGFLDIVGLGLIEHTPLFIRKDYWGEAFGCFPKKAEKTRQSRFRKRTNLCPYKVYRYNMLKNHADESVAVHLPDLLKISRFHKLTNRERYQKRIFAKMSNQMPDYYCLNDDFRGNPNPKVVETVRSFLMDKYPNPSTFEKPEVLA